MAHGLRRVPSMGARRIEDLIAWQLAHAFKLEVYGLLKSTPAAMEDYRFRDQLRASAASVGMNIGEGFRRYRAREFSRYLTIALASLGEATLWLRDGVDRGHFPEGACDAALALARRCHIATVRLKHSLDATLPG